MKGLAVHHVRARLRRLNHELRGPLWFPQVPLAFLFAFAGAWLLRWDMASHWNSFVAGVLAGHPEITPRRLPQLLIGTGMLIMALGLLFRSRVAWVMTLLLAATAVASLLLGHRQGAQVIIAYLLAIAATLIVAGTSFNRSSVTASTLFAFTSVVMLGFYATFGAYYLGAHFQPPITDLVTALYYAIVTTSTVGYGDITPQTTEAKLFTVSIIVLGVAVFTTSLTAVLAPMVTRSLQRIVTQRRKKMKRENHFVVIGNTSLAVNTWRELVTRGQPVTRIVRESSVPVDANGADLIVGDPGNTEVLKQAGAEKAQAVLSMLDDDSENAFVVLAVRELKASARTVVAVNDARHLSRIRLVQPDVVIAPQILGGELAAMIMCGEEITSEFVMKSVLQQDGRPAPEPKRS